MAPGDSERSSAATALTPANALAICSAGKGRKLRSFSRPARMPVSRSLSTMTRVVPAVEPRTTIATSASSSL